MFSDTTAMNSPGFSLSSKFTFEREESEIMRLKFDQNQDVLQGSQQNKNSHGSEVKYFTHGKHYGFSFCRRKQHAKSLKMPSS